MKKWLIGLACACLGATMAAGQYIVDFEDATKGTYASGTVSLGGKNWDMTEAMVGGSETADWKIGEKNARMRGYGTSSMTMLEDLTTGLGTISFQYRRYGTDSQVDWMVEYSSNGGTSWTQIGSSFTAPASDDVQTFSQAVNVGGNVRVRIKRATESGTTNRRLCIDNITMTASGPAEFGVTFDRPNGFEVEEGVATLITATAANGVAPYSYSWTTTMGVGDYLASDNTFAVSGTAPVGSFSATVVATDSDSPAKSVTNSIAFSVVAPAPKYAISIVTNAPANGTVTTTPATEAVAGATVTVNATPVSGYAVASIVVNGGAVTVTGNTFAMPAGPAIVTVTFAENLAEGIVDFRFNNAPFLAVTAKDANLVVSDMALTSGTIETGITTGDYFPDEPYIEETNGWTAETQAAAKAFLFTITPADGASVTINGISFRAYATSAGPSAFGFDVGGVFTHEVDAPSASLVVVSQAVVGVQSQTGAITVKIQGWRNGSRETQGTGVFRLDDVVVHGSVSTGPLELGVSFDRANGFEVEEGVATLITATAANGVAPYSYSWTTTMGVGDYLASDNTFAVSGTAPVGSFSATVVATDSDSPAKSVTNSIAFSVVAPAPKYAISIVTNAPANGTVTTTPATEAVAGATVTVNATPVSGYAVASIVVNGGAVTVTGNTFAMPAGPATVTVTFEEFVDIATLPIAESYTSTFDWTTLPGWSGVSMSTYADGDMSFNASGDMLTVHFDGAPEELSFTLQGRASAVGESPLMFVAEESVDGATWTTVASIDETPITTGTVAFGPYALSSASRYVRWNYVKKFGFNLGLNNVSITGSSVPVTQVVIQGDVEGTVGEFMALTISLTNSAVAADDWWIDLTDPLAQEVLGFNWNPATGAFSFVPTLEGTYVLTATAVEGFDTVIATRTQNLLVVGGGDPPQIASIQMVGGNLEFDVPEGFGVVRVEGAGPTLLPNGEYNWQTLVEGVDYDLSPNRLRVILLTGSAPARVIRIVLTRAFG